MDQRSDGPPLRLHRHGLPGGHARFRHSRVGSAWRRRDLADRSLTGGAVEVRHILLSTESWNLVTENFGALAPIYGTIITSAIAIIIAVPIGIAIFLTELSPRPLRRPIAIAVELLAGIVTLGAEQQPTSEGCSLDGPDVMVECIAKLEYVAG